MRDDGRAQGGPLRSILPRWVMSVPLGPGTDGVPGNDLVSSGMLEKSYGGCTSIHVCVCVCVSEIRYGLVATILSLDTAGCFLLLDILVSRFYIYVYAYRYML